MSLTFESIHRPTGFALCVIDDGRVGWAYLCGPEGEVLGDVWLYNHGPAPTRFDFNRQPLANVAALARPLPQPPPETPADIEVRWRVDGELLLADVWLRGQLLARVTPGSQPGWSALALDDGPCACVLPEADGGVTRR